MSRFHYPPVDADDARGRRIAGLARAGAVLALFAFLAATSAMTDWSGHRYSSAQLMPSASEFEPAAGRVEAMTSAEVPEARPAVAPAAEPTEADTSQQGYVTHGG